MMASGASETEEDRRGVVVEGVWISKHLETNRPMREQIDCIRALEMRDDDVILCAFPKSGTHWLWEVTSMLLAGQARYDSRSKMCAMLEATQIETIQQMASPRIFNTHLPANMLPAQAKEKRVKIIHVYRNIKDVFVSLYFHFRQYPGRENLTLQSLFSQAFFSPENVNGNYFAFLRTMDGLIQANPQWPIFNVSYEETKQDPVSVIRRLADFLGPSTSRELCTDIARATSLANMREADRSKVHASNAPPAQMYRKGEVGDWRNHLTEEQSQRLEAAVHRQLQGTRFSFLYTL